MDFPPPNLPAASLPQPQQTPPQRHAENVAKKAIIVTAIVSGLLAIIALSVVAMHTYATNRPEYIMAQALQALGSQSSVNGQATVQYSGTDGKQTVDADVLAISDITDSRRHELVLGTGAGDRRIELAIRQFEDGLAYGRISNADRAAAVLAPYAPGVSATLQKPAGSELVQRVGDHWYALTPAQPDIARPTGAQYVDRAAKAPSVANIEGLANLYAEYPFLSIGGQRPDQTINGRSHSGFRLKFNKPVFMEFLRVAERGQFLNGLITSHVRQVIESSLEKGNPTIDVWIGKHNRQFGRLQITGPGGDVVARIDLTDTRPRGKTAVDRPQLVRPYTETAADLQAMLETLGLVTPAKQ